jgi:hypothetical protein
MSRQVLNVLVEGLTITAVVVAFLATSARIARPATVATVKSAGLARSDLTSAKDLRGLSASSLQQFFSVGGAESLVPESGRSDMREFFPTGASRRFYPGTLSPLPEDLFLPDQVPNALKLIEVPTR